MPIAIQKKKLFVSLFGTGINETFKYSKYFSMIPNGPTPKPAFTRGFFKVAEVQKPKPQTIAIAMADAEFGRNACEGAHQNAKTSGFKIVYEKSYPPSTTDFTPIVRAIQAANPDLLVICSYPLDTVGMVKAMHEVGFKPKMWGGAMVGLQATVFKTQLGPLLNGVVNFETWLPVKSMEFPGSLELLKKYQERAKAAGTDPLGYYMPVWAYAYLQVLGDAIAATKSLNDDMLADYIHKTTFKTVVGDVKFNEQGEWTEERTLAAQFQNIKGNSIDDFRDLKTEVIIYPPQYKSGEVIYPYEKAIVTGRAFIREQKAAREQFRAAFALTGRRCNGRSHPQIELADQVVVVELGGRAALEGDLAVHDHVTAVGDADGLREVLLGHQHRELVVVLELLDGVDGAGDQQRRQSDRGLVHQQDARRQHQRAGERQHLLLAAAHAAGELAAPLGQARERLEAEVEIALDLRARFRAGRRRAEGFLPPSISGTAGGLPAPARCRDRRSARFACRPGRASRRRFPRRCGRRRA